MILMDVPPPYGFSLILRPGTQRPRTRLESGRHQEDHTNSTYQLHSPATNSIH